MEPTLARRPAVAGLFYPADARALAAMVDGLVAEAPAPHGAPPKALIVPHAGYPYSGPIAARAFGELRGAAGFVRRVVLLGPAHRVALRGVALPSARRLLTPLGAVQVDVAAAARALELPGVSVRDDVHESEHSLEVQLPFLQRLLPEAAVLPLAVGHAPPRLVADLLLALWGGPETLLVVSTDLSHYLPYEVARRLDRAAAQRILRLAEVEPEEACGAAPLNGLLLAAREKRLVPELLELRSSGDTSGSREAVVGYGAFALREAHGASA